MRLIDADSLIKRYEKKMLKTKDDRNAQILLRVLKDSVDQEQTVEVVPENQPVGVVTEYPNGMVAMRGETYEEYNKIAVDNLPTRHIPKRMDAVEYLKTLKRMHEGKPMRQFFALFPQGGTEEEKVAVVEKWAEEHKQ